MTMYEKIKNAVSVPEAAKSYGLTVGKNGMARCPFHEDHTPSLKLNEDYADMVDLSKFAIFEEKEDAA